MSLVGLLASGRVKIVNGQLQLIPVKPQLRNKFGVRLQNQDVLLDSDSDYPSSSSHSSPIPLLRSRPARHDHDDIDVDLTLHNEDLDCDDAPELDHRQGKRKRNTPVLQDCLWSSAKPCCGTCRCNANYTPAQVLLLRAFFFDLSQMERRQFTKSRTTLKSELAKKKFFIERPSFIDVTPNLKCTPVIDSTQQVCVTFWKFVTGASNQLIYPTTLGADGRILVPLALSQNRNRASYNNVSQWLREEAKYHEVSPDSDMIYLPQASRKVVYEQYAAEMRLQGTVPCSEPYFKRVWRTNEDTAIIKLRKYLRFSKCAKCVAFRQARADTTDIHKLNAIKAKELEHLLYNRGERDSYHDRQQKARTYPSMYGSKIIDGSDNGAYALPFFHEKTIKSGKAWKMPLHVFGCISHGLQPLIVTMLDTVKLGTNSTIEVLHQQLIHEHETSGLPEILFMQLDNTTRQCKSRFMMAWFGYLVHIGLFKEVLVSFLEVGHTHEDIDQMFSRISIYLTGNSTLSREAFGEACQYAYTSDDGYPRVLHRDRVANISGWMNDHVPRMDSIRSWQQFRIFPRVPGTGDATHREPRMQCRKWCGTKKGPGGVWRALQDHMIDSPVFKNTKAASAFLAAPPFSTQVPPSQVSDKAGAAEKSPKTPGNS